MCKQPTIFFLTSGFYLASSIQGNDCFLADVYIPVYHNSNKSSWYNKDEIIDTELYFVGSAKRIVFLKKLHFNFQFYIS